MPAIVAESRTNTDNHIALPIVSTDEAKSPLYAALIAVINLVNGRLSLGSGENQTFTGNLIGVFVDVVTPATINTNFTVYHNLKYIPQCYIIVNKYSAADIYTASDQAPDENTVTLKCTVASATIKLWIF